MNAHASRWIVAAAIAMTALGVQAQELKIGYVNSDRVLREAAPAKAAQAKLEAEFSRRERELAEQASRIASSSASAASSRRISTPARTRSWLRWWNAPTRSSGRSSRPKSTT